MLIQHAPITSCLVVLAALVRGSVSQQSRSNTHCPNAHQLSDDLQKHLSSLSTIRTADVAVSRWSDYAAPRPGFVVDVALESDVAPIVRLAGS